VIAGGQPALAFIVLYSVFKEHLVAEATWHTLPTQIPSGIPIGRRWYPLEQLDEVRVGRRREAPCHATTRRPDGQRSGATGNA